MLDVKFVIKFLPIRIGESLLLFVLLRQPDGDPSAPLRMTKARANEEL